MAAFRYWRGQLLDALFPRYCLGCNRPGSYLCHDCLTNDALPLEPPWCDRCGLPSRDAGPCLFCRDHPLLLEGLRSLYAYQGVPRDAILNFKYKGLRAVGEELGGLLASFLRTHPLPVDMLVPVPLHQRRQRERGYNQAEILCRIAAQQTGLKVLPAALQRIRWTVPQARMEDRTHREENLTDAFAPRAELVSGKRVLLVDDVCTTGATLNACAQALLTAGASAVWGLTVAREL